MSTKRLRKKTARQRAFSKLAAIDWEPAVGEFVMVRRTAGTLSVIRSVGVVLGRTLLDGVFEIHIVRGPQHYRGAWHVSDLRPV